MAGISCNPLERAALDGQADALNQRAFISRPLPSAPLPSPTSDRRHCKTGDSFSAGDRSAERIRITWSF